MPSLFEPCGLSQLMSLRYGTLPIVRETGGLKDTVEPYNEFEKTGTGFSFTNYNAHEMLNTVRYAERIYYDKKRDWNKIVERAMSQDFSWQNSARQYEELYKSLIGEVYNQMKIIDRLNEDRINISFEVFPPKTDAGFANVQRATDEIAKLDPSYISVTYGAGGGTSKNTAKIASHIKDDLHVLSLAHLTCASSTKEKVREVIRNLKELGIENILALRGDIPEGMKFPDGDRFHYAYELVEEIRKQGDFCIGAACYPEGHVENEHKEDDIRFLKQKVDCGVDFLTTQMFFDNDIHYNFLYRIREAGITVPVLPGIMPITSAAQMKRSQELSGTVFPRRFLALLDRFGSSPEAMMQAGIAYATDQIIDLLANGVKNIHIYSMNKPEVATKIMSNISEIIKC